MTHAAEPTGVRVLPSQARDLLPAAPASGPARGVGSGQFSGHNIRRGASIASGADRESGDVAAQLGVTAGRDRHSLNNEGGAAMRASGHARQSGGSEPRWSPPSDIDNMGAAAQAGATDGQMAALPPVQPVSLGRAWHRLGSTQGGPTSAHLITTARPSGPAHPRAGMGTLRNRWPSTPDATAAQPA